MALNYCSVQWRIPFGYRIDLGAGSQQETSYSQKTIAGREVQRRPSAILSRINISILLVEGACLTPSSSDQNSAPRLFNGKKAKEVNA